MDADESKWELAFGMVEAIVEFGNTKTIISNYKDYYCIKSFQLNLKNGLTPFEIRSKAI